MREIADDTPAITLSEDSLYREDEEKEESAQFVVLRLSNEWYGLDVMGTRQVVPVDRITSLPSSPAHIAGIVNLRGEILSVTDLRKVFGLPQPALTDQARLVVIEDGARATGILADETAGIVETPVSSIHPTLATIPPDRARLLRGQCRHGERLIGILAVNKVLGIGGREET